MEVISKLPSNLFGLCFCFIILTAVDASSAIKKLDLKKTKIWGPGLKITFHMPVRYFFIQTVDQDGENITESIGDKPFEISFEVLNDRARIYHTLLDRKDGLYIVRYKVHFPHEDITINVRHEGQHVAKSPYKLKGFAYQEKCNCPQPDIEKWFKSIGCPATYRQIDSDLAIFNDVDLEKSAAETVNRFSNRGMHSLCHYKIIDNKIYRKTYGQHVGFKMFSDAILLSITRKDLFWKPGLLKDCRYNEYLSHNNMWISCSLVVNTAKARDVFRYNKVHLPNLEFFVNLGDWPLEKKSTSESPVPIFSWCGSDETKDIVMPTYDITEATLEMMGRQSLDIFSVMGNSPGPWENKTEIGFWRGRDSRQERLDLVMMSRKYPETIDAKMTRMFFFPHDQDKYGELVSHISFFDFFKYKYQLNIDGTVAAYRFPYLMAGDAVVFKQDSNYYEHFYKDLKPYIHYVPFKQDLSDLREKIKWAKENDEKVKEISRNGRNFVMENLLPEDIFCYHVKLFHKYSSKLKSPPLFPDETWELVKHPEEHNSSCDCRFKKKKSNKTKKEEKEKATKQKDEL